MVLDMAFECGEGLFGFNPRIFGHLPKLAVFVSGNYGSPIPPFLDPLRISLHREIVDLKEPSPLFAVCAFGLGSHFEYEFHWLYT
jgi:hypothetical protein